MHHLHTLTALTGRDAGANRTVIVNGFEARRQTVIVAAIGALPALLAAAVLWTLVGQFAVLAIPAVEGVTFWLLAARSRRGLQQRTYEALLDRRRSDVGRFTLCGRTIDPELNELGTLVAASVPNPSLTTGPAGASLPVTPTPVGPVPWAAS